MMQDYPGDEDMRVSHETIYSWFYVLPKGELKSQLLAGLRRHRARRVAMPRIPSNHGPIAGMVSIDDRPDEVAERKIPGHWEGDLIIGKAHASAVGTLVERTTRFTVLVPLPDGRKSEDVRTALKGTLATLPKLLVRSLTWDQGSELAQHREFTVDTGVAVYFAHPHSPWERGSNENTNGLIRQYLPKSTVLPSDRESLEFIAAELNGRPRRTLGWRTPAEAFSELISSSVAMAG
jgi:IS30 family transposase